MRDLNRVVLVGRLVRDVDFRYTSNGELGLAKFSIANNESYMQNQERKEYVSYFDIVVWGNIAITCDKYLRKGSSVIIEGKLRQNRWTDQTTGTNHSKIEVIADFVYFNSPPQQQNGGNGQNNFNPSNPSNPSNNLNNKEQSQQQPKQNYSPPSKSQNKSGDFNANPWDDVPFNSNSNEGFDEYNSSDDDIPF